MMSNQELQDANVLPDSVSATAMDGPPKEDAEGGKIRDVACVQYRILGITVFIQTVL